MAKQKRVNKKERTKKVIIRTVETQGSNGSARDPNREPKALITVPGFGIEGSEDGASRGGGVKRFPRYRATPGEAAIGNHFLACRE
ncbi:MAG: hypothetical protein HDS10_05945 [Bacteroides sp.]|nr:hypothetical protein [Bacteroides sp.]